LHPLFAEYARALDDDPTAANEIQRRAAEWLRAHGMPVEAVEQASAAGDHDMVASMLAHVVCARRSITRVKFVRLT
jgi:ATP/maltotriose-dependent transcriptional regulator MalT